MGGFQSLVCTLRISRLALRVGKGKASSLSNRPGRRSAGSRLSGLFVAPTTMTFGLVRARGGDKRELDGDAIVVDSMLLWGQGGEEKVLDEEGRSVSERVAPSRRLFPAMDWDQGKRLDERNPRDDGSTRTQTQTDDDVSRCRLKHKPKIDREGIYSQTGKYTVVCACVCA